jgi:hypothetical protein
MESAPQQLGALRKHKPADSRGGGKGDKKVKRKSWSKKKQRSE